MPFRTAAVERKLLTLAEAMNLAVLAHGSDTWVNQRWSEYDNLMKGYRVWLGELPPETARRIAWDNGARLFGVSDR